MQTLDEIEACLIQEQNSIASHHKVIELLHEARDTLKRKQAAELVQQRARQLKQESEIAASIVACRAFMDFKAPIHALAPEKLRAFYDAIITECRKTIPAGHVVSQFRFSGPALQANLIKTVGLPEDIFLNNNIKHQGRTRFIQLVLYVFKRFNSEELSISIIY